MGFDRKQKHGEREGKALPPRTSATQSQSVNAAPFLGNRQATPSSVLAVQRMAGNAAATAYVQRVTDEEREKANKRRERWAERDIARGGTQAAESFTTHDTPFGPYNERPGRGGAPYITTNMDQYPGTQKTYGRYVREEESQFIGLVPELDAEQFLPLVEALKGKRLSKEEIEGLSDDQCRAAATLMGIASAEAVREPGALKHIRSALRRQADPSHEAPEFLEDYPQGRVGGTQHENNIRSGRTRRATPEVNTINDASSSSDESTSRRRR
ncbi:hypothetical protein ACIOEX_24480 [Streptomyces sp. NPDC087850]|uniref:hypothetical protein n=1 Tax=Streptomyces sp. NPDC087850 TaxID=3365809 RepID=UPI00382EE835